MSPPDLKMFPRTCWSSSWTTQSMWRMGRGISFLLFSEQILDFFSYNQILDFFSYILRTHWHNYATHLMFSRKRNWAKWKTSEIRVFFMISLFHNGLKSFFCTLKISTSRKTFSQVTHRYSSHLSFSWNSLGCPSSSKKKIWLNMWQTWPNFDYWKKNVKYICVSEPHF